MTDFFISILSDVIYYNLISVEGMIQNFLIWGLASL